MQPQDDKDKNESLDTREQSLEEQEQEGPRQLESDQPQEEVVKEEKDTFINNPHQNDNLDFDQLTNETVEPEVEPQQVRPKPADVYEEVEIPNLRNPQRSSFENNQTTRPIFDSQMGFNPKYSNNPKGGKSAKLQLLILALIGLAVIGGTFYLLKNQFKSNSDESATTTAEVAPTSTPTPIPEVLDRSKFTVRVLNGTKTSGLAASVSAKLKELGYKTDKTGNATNSAFERTVVRVKAGQEALLAQLIKDLMPDFDATSSSPIAAGDVADVEVILGAK